MSRGSDELKTKVERIWRRRQYQAVRRVGELMKDRTPWAERTIADVVALKVAETVGSDIRAERSAGGTQITLGVMAYIPRIESSTDWETLADQVNNGKIIDAVPQQVVQRAVGPVSELPEQLGEGVRQEEATAPGQNGTEPKEGG